MKRFPVSKFADMYVYKFIFQFVVPSGKNYPVNPIKPTEKFCI